MALKAAEQGKYDIILIDHMMPEMDGIQTAEKIRALGGKYETLPLIALTGVEGENVRDMFLEHGFTDYISKPVNIDELGEIIKKHLPPDKIIEQTENVQPVVSKNNDNGLIITFTKNNLQTYEKIMDLLNTGDYETAHRTVHNLKSAAGYVGKKTLQAAAFSLETSLGEKPPAYTQNQLDTLKTELSAALEEFKPILNEAENEKQKTAKSSDEDPSAILNLLIPLLKKSDFGALDYVARLQGIKGMEKMAEHIENYEFEEALKLID
jgi:CheY-like chemotaxis protein